MPGAAVPTVLSESVVYHDTVEQESDQPVVDVEDITPLDLLEDEHVAVASDDSSSCSPPSSASSTSTSLSYLAGPLSLDSVFFL